MGFRALRVSGPRVGIALKGDFGVSLSGIRRGWGSHAVQGAAKPGCPSVGSPEVSINLNSTLAKANQHHMSRVLVKVQNTPKPHLADF